MRVLGPNHDYQFEVHDRCFIRINGTLMVVSLVMGALGGGLIAGWVLRWAGY